MRDFVVKALIDAYIKMDSSIPQTKKKEILINLYNVDVEPINMLEFMKNNNIPDNAYFTSEECSTLGSSSPPCIGYEIDVPTTTKDKEDYCRKKFNNIAYRFVYDSLTQKGYKKVGYDTGLLKPFNDTTVYDMYINAEYDRLVEYYSISFHKI